MLAALLAKLQIVQPFPVIHSKNGYFTSERARMVNAVSEGGRDPFFPGKS